MKFLLSIVLFWVVALASCQDVSAQIRIVPKERLDSVACPPLSPDAAFLHLDRTTVLLGELSSEGLVSKVLLKISNSGEKELKISRILAANFIGLLIVYAMGMIYYYIICNYVINTPIGFWPLFLYCFLMAVPGDILLCFLAAFLTKRIKPAYDKMRIG